MTRTLCTLNLNGIRSAHRRGFAEWLAKAQPDVLCVQELRAGLDDVEEHVRVPPGYATQWLCAEKKGYSGTALFARGAPKKFACGHGFDHLANEGRLVRADWPDLTVISLYVPSGSSSPERLAAKLRFMELVLPVFRGWLREKLPIAVCGDFNVAPTALDLARPKQNEKNSGFLPEERAWFAELLAMGWVDSVRALHPGEPALYSWWSNRGAARENDVGWRLDHVLASPMLAPRITKAWIEKNAGLSDHAPVWVEIADA